MIKIDHISKSYGQHQILSDVTIHLKQGEIIALLGANGAGKSTLMKILSGVLAPNAGNISFFDKKYDKDLLQIKKKIGYLSEDNPLYEDMYVKEYLAYIADMYHVDKLRVQELIDRVGLGNEYKKKIGVLSKGNRQKVGLAQAIINKPSFLILDEPTNGLDPTQRHSFNTLLKELSKDTIILYSTHILSEVKNVCNRFLFMDKGRVVADEPMERIETIENIFNTLMTDENYSR